MTAHKSPKNDALRSGYSLIELLMVVAILSSIAAGAVFGVKNVVQATESTKLQRDVGVVNSAIRTYLLSGGFFRQSDLQNPKTVLSKLKCRAGDQNAKELAGLRGAMMDERLSFELQTAAEAVEGVPRARFISDPASPRFIIQTSGPPGIKRFMLDNSMAETDFGTENRKATLKLAKQDPWVWDYTDAGARRVTPASPPRVNLAMNNPSPADITNLVLNAPDFSLASGSAPLKQFPRSLTLSPTNPAGSAQIIFSVNGGPFESYTGPITIDPGMTVTAVSATLDTDRYDDSPAASRAYQSSPVTPMPLVTFSKPQYTYFELGGEAAPGTPLPLPAGAVTGLGMILNLSLIPLTYQNSDVFRFVWTTDGSDPRTSATASRQADFRDGFLVVPIPLSLAAFGTASSIAVNATVKSQKPGIVTDSRVINTSLHAQKLPLRKPLINFNGPEVTLALDLTNRDMPKDARIYYTLDGTDPGVDAQGNPRSGTLYTGTPFTPDSTAAPNITVRARVYPPVGYVQFFTASSDESKSLRLPANTDAYVAGIFVNPLGSPMRNLTRLDAAGQVDPRFNTGTGASNGSLVGIVRQSGTGVLAGGDFDTMNGTPRPALVRLKADGSVDTAFDAALSNK